MLSFLVSSEALGASSLCGALLLTCWSLRAVRQHGCLSSVVNGKWQSVKASHRAPSLATHAPSAEKCLETKAQPLPSGKTINTKQPRAPEEERRASRSGFCSILVVGLQVLVVLVLPVECALALITRVSADAKVLPSVSLPAAVVGEEPLAVIAL